MQRPQKFYITLHRVTLTHFACFCFVLLSVQLVAAEPESPSVQDHFKSAIQPFLKKYCFQCHGSEKQTGERRFDRLSAELKDDNTLVDYQEILDQLNLGEMPPVDEPQPQAAEQKKVIAILTRSIQQYHASRRASAKQPVLRRLNSREYHNTVRDLFQLNMTMFTPTESFPKDQTVEHLDNIGQTLVTSGYLLDQYLTAAEKVVDKAVFPIEKPAQQTWTFRNNFKQQPEIDQVFRKVNQFKWMTLFDVPGADKHEGAYGPIHAFADGVPNDGFYEIRIHAEAVNRENPYDSKFLGLDPTEQLRLGVVAGNRHAGPLHKPQPVEPLLAEIDLADEKQWYTVKVWLDAGYTPRFTFQNGLMDARNLWGRLIKKYPEQFPKQQKRGIVETRFNAIKYGKLPQIRIHEIEISGPIFEKWPVPSQREIFGDSWESVAGSGVISRSKMRERFTAIATKAYRRPVTDAEIDRIMSVADQRIASGRNNIEAFRDGLQAILCSPGFIYITEPQQPLAGSCELANRLSYFLWSSMPDEELIRLAINNKLNAPDVLAQQVERMLDDPRSAAFINGFLDSWLTLRDLGSTPPDRSSFKNYYHYNLEQAMRSETTNYARHLLDENLTIQSFIDSNFTFVNRPLARFYGLEPPQESGFHKVVFDSNLRGGLLGQASVLTVTANGIDTSPVNRGVWVLENILGTPPSPPPPDVEPLDPDIRGAKTIRDQLRKHRSVASCNDCHRKIDPLGFALENFDAIGRYRTVYNNKAKIESAAKLPNGKSFSNIGELKQILLENSDQFARALTEKVLSYALGRQLEPTDRPAVDAIVNSLQQHQYGFRHLIHEVVMSEPFRTE